MKCPYIVDYITVLTDHFKYNDENLNVCSYQYKSDMQIMHDCLQQDCAAWQNGKCTYKV